MDAELRGIRALVTRPASQGGMLCAAIRARGGEALALPLLEIVPVEGEERAAALGILSALPGFDLAIFISTNAVAQAFEYLKESVHAWPRRLECLAIGAATRSALAGHGVAAGSAGVAMNTEELLALPALRTMDGRKVLLMKGGGGRAELADALRTRGATVTECVLYRRRMPGISGQEFQALLQTHRPNTLLAASGETLQNLLGLLGKVPAGTIAGPLVFVVPGERVAGLAAHTVPGTVEVAANATDAAMLAALARVALRARAGTEKK